VASHKRAGAPNIGLRATISVGLLVGFYVLAVVLILAFAGGGAVLVYMLISHGRLNVQAYIGAGMLIAAGFAVLRGVLASARVPDGDVPLGIPTSPATEPRLWSEVRELAGAAGAPVPDEIHLVPGVAAFVQQDSKMLGLVKGRVLMGVGLGLLSVLDRDGLRSVLAHELGHISGRDTRLGPLTYRARFALMRTIEHLEHKESWIQKLLARLFRGYFLLFMRYAMAVSRAQERAADRASVRVAGPWAAARALETVGIADHAFDFFTDRYVLPLWQRGRFPEDMYAGFRALCAEPSRREEFGKLREAVLAEETGRWDSHPSIGERIRLIMSEGAQGGPPPPSVPAWRVLADPARTEREMAMRVAGAVTGGAQVRPITFQLAAPEILGPGAVGAGERVRSAAIVVGGQWHRSGLDQALELVAAGRGAELAKELEIEGYAEVGDRALVGALQTAIASEIVERHGGRWSVSWSAGVGVDWPGPSPRELAERALSGPQGIAFVRGALHLPLGEPLRVLPPLGVAAHA
jgi:Zn-dependent protease with chaperone function